MTNAKSRPRKRRWTRVAAAAALILPAMVLYLYLRPIGAGDLSSRARPAGTYAEAIDRIRLLDAGMEALGPSGRTLLLTHGRRTAKVAVLLHGYTKSPHEFESFGKLLFARGYNVLIPRLPRHGYADRMTEDQAQLTAEEVARFGDEVVDCAAGLGDHVTVVGLSAGGLTTAWLAQHRADIDRAVVMAPAFGYKKVPTSLTRPVMNAYLTLPNAFHWWDEAAQENLKPALYYPRWSTHALAQLLRLSFATQAKAAEGPPAARSVLVITNANDASVNNEITDSVAANWRKSAASRVKTFEFAATEGLDHDFIDPDMPGSQPASVYPRLLQMITR